MKTVAITVLIFTVAIMEIAAEFHSSILEWAEFVSTEAKVKRVLDDYIRRDELYIRKLKRFQLIFKPQILSGNSTDHHKINPLDLLEKTQNLNMIRSSLIPIIKHKMEDIPLSKMFTSLQFPTEENLNSVRLALARLQSTYNLPHEDLVKGKIFGVKYEGKLSPNDCLHIGLAAAEEFRFEEAENWFKAGLKQSWAENADKLALMFNLMIILLKQEKIVEASKFYEEMLRVDPNNDKLPDFKLKLHNSLLDGSDLFNVSNIVNYTKHFEKFCSNVYLLTTSNDLRCYYKITNAFTYLAPFKTEEISREPKMFIFHDVLSDEEISQVKGMAYNAFNKSQVYGTNSNELSNLRLSQSAHLKKDNVLILRIINRVEDMSDLSKEYNEDLQVANYGIGGLFYSHYDYLPPYHPAIKELGNRIGTVLFYLSNVEYGGATAFPKLKLAVTPKKGTALFWYNTHSDGEIDVRTIHGGCPVLLGSKWIATQWLREFDQEFRRPCLERTPKDLIFSYDENFD